MIGNGASEATVEVTSGASSSDVIGLIFFAGVAMISSSIFRRLFFRAADNADEGTMTSSIKDVTSFGRIDADIVVEII